MTKNAALFYWDADTLFFGLVSNITLYGSVAIIGIIFIALILGVVLDIQTSRIAYPVQTTITSGNEIIGIGTFHATNVSTQQETELIGSESTTCHTYWWGTKCGVIIVNNNTG